MDYVIVHHSACRDGAFHYLVTRDGDIRSLLPDAAQGRHKRTVAVAIEGDFDEERPEPAQIKALKRLLVRLKLRYPGIHLGGHRQVRGNETTCPGQHFPLSALRRWATTTWETARDEAIEKTIERQYGD